MSFTTERRIAIVYEPESVPLLKLTESAARNGFRPVWVAGHGDGRMLGRLGSVVVTDGYSTAEIAATLETFGVVGVTTFADSKIEQAAEIATLLGLPANPAQKARLLVNKIAQRQALADAGVPGPRFVGIESPCDTSAARERLQMLDYPVVVKPAFGYGGRDTFCLPDFRAAAAELTIRCQADPWRPTIIEELLGDFPPRDRGGFGDYVSVEVVVDDGVPSVLAITGRMPLAEPFRETGAFLPSSLCPAERSDVAAVAVKAALALGVHCGCLHIEIKLTAAGPQIIEVNGRLPGGGITDLVATQVGVDLFECALNSAAGRPALRPLTSAAGVHYQLALQPPLGRRVRLRPDWSTRLHAIAGVDHVALRSTTGQVGLRDGSYGYLLMVNGLAEDHAALLETYRQLNGLLVSD
ncbi:acetyl-CoA carboxylase biotin carboxylase subunit family protein [Mycolicibacterium sp. CBMA 226]|uniref:ATP-grasp domain-containing protein n=1 Tax=Mycolicibacterium sp. CBMA 226 TaxID=2606611 RepID=UPI001411D70B|nr:ATP-grasp domain-containing protein [Mycolicibacterium sp. CBMA 226]